MGPPLPLKFELYQPPPRASYDAVEGDYGGGVSTYAAYNYNYLVADWSHASSPRTSRPRCRRRGRSSSPRR
jgi:hypothetical protein